MVLLHGIITKKMKKMCLSKICQHGKKWWGFLLTLSAGYIVTPVDGDSDQDGHYHHQLV